AVAVSSMTPHQKELNDGVRKVTGEDINSVQIGTYDAVWALKAAMEKAQSIDPEQVAKVMPEVKFQSFFGEVGFGGKDVYGSDQQMQLRVIITQSAGTTLMEVGRVQKLGARHMQDNLQLLFTALQISSVYILFSLGLTIIFGVLKVVNFAHG